MVLSYFFEKGTPILHSRDILWSQAISAFLSSPLYGGSFPIYSIAPDIHLPNAHNFILTTAGNHGLLGLTIIATLAIAIRSRWTVLPNWSHVGIMTYLFLSLIDEPLPHFGCMLIFCALITRSLPDTKEKETAIEN